MVRAVILMLVPMIACVQTELLLWIIVIVRSGTKSSNAGQREDNTTTSTPSSTSSLPTIIWIHLQPNTLINPQGCKWKCNWGRTAMGIDSNKDEDWESGIDWTKKSRSRVPPAACPTHYALRLIEWVITTGKLKVSWFHRVSPQYRLAHARVCRRLAIGKWALERGATELHFIRVINNVREENFPINQRNDCVVYANHPIKSLNCIHSTLQIQLQNGYWYRQGELPAMRWYFNRRGFR